MPVASQSIGSLQEASARWRHSVNLQTGPTDKSEQNDMSEQNDCKRCPPTNGRKASGHWMHTCTAAQVHKNNCNVRQDRNLERLYEWKSNSYSVAGRKRWFNLQVSIIQLFASCCTKSVAELTVRFLSLSLSLSLILNAISRGKKCKVIVLWKPAGI